MRPGEEPPFHYCDLCQGIAPIVIASRRDFMAAQGLVLAVALLVLLLNV